MRKFLQTISLNKSGQISPPKGFYWYVAKFIGSFLTFYVGTLLIIGFSSKDNLYSPFVAKYLNYIAPLRKSLLYGSDLLVKLLGYPTSYIDQYTLTIEGGQGVRIVYSCIGYGVLGFWAAFIVANKGSMLVKIKWMLGGWGILWFLNVLRLTFLLLADVKNWSIPFGVDHHTVFNLVAYGFIFLLMYFFDKKQRRLAA